jgi:hypothetical protein
VVETLLRTVTNGVEFDQFTRDLPKPA